MTTRKRLQTAISGFGCIFRPVYANKKTGERKQQAVWWMKYQTNEGEVRRSTGQRDQEAAYNELAKMAGRKANGEMLGASPERVTFNSLFDLLEADYRQKQRSSLTDMKSRVDALLRPAFGEMRVLDLRKADVQKFIEARTKAGRSPGTINKLLAYLRRSMKLGMEADPLLVLRIPPWFKKLEGEQERTGTITHEMYRALSSAFAASHARLAFVIGYHTGLRRGAILSLKWDWVDWNESVIRIPPPKRQTNKNKPRLVPVYGEMKSFLEMAYAEWQTTHACPYIVQHEGKRVFSIKGAVETAFRVSGLVYDTGRKRKDGTPLLKPVALFHDLRRTAATMLHEAGFDLAAIMDICGWKSVIMPKRYIQQSVKRTQEVGKTLEAFLEQKEARITDRKTPRPA